MALVTNLPIGIGRTWGFETKEEAIDQGREMAHDAWVDFSQSTDIKEHIQKSKTLFVLTQGPVVGSPQDLGKKGFEHFLAEGITNFMGSSRETRISNVIGGSSGDGLAARLFHQFYGKLGEQSGFKILEKEAVCALIPHVHEPSIGSDVAPTRKVGRSYTFHFDRKAEPKFMYLKRIGNRDPRELLAQIIYENEARISRELGRPIINEKELLKLISEFEGLPVHPALGKYGFALPFGNYAPVLPIRVTPKKVFELSRPIRSLEASIKGYVAEIDCTKVQKGARNVFHMLRENRGFSARDPTLLVSCITRRLAEILAGSESKTEAEILKEALSSTQVAGFLAYGELYFTHLLQEPYHHNFSLWGITFRSKTKGKKESKPVELARIEVPTTLPDRMSTGHRDLDDLLYGGIPENYAVVLTSPSSDERDLLIKFFLESGVKEGQVAFYVTTKASGIEYLAEEYPTNFYLFICNPQADKIIKTLPNVFKLHGVENLTDINIALTSALRKLDVTPKGTRRVCIEIVSDILLQHHTVLARRWLNALIPELKSRGFTTLAVLDPEIHSQKEVRAIVGIFEGEINMYDKKTEEGLKKHLRIKKMTSQRYSENELLLRKET
jgi:KaiC/GvpD/RAD55 family RecA-like ATPase